MLDELETQIENTHLIGALKDSPDLQLDFAPYETLTDFESKLEPITQTDLIFGGEQRVLVSYLFGEYLNSIGLSDVNAVICAVRAYRNTHVGERKEEALKLWAEHFQRSTQAQGQENTNTNDLEMKENPDSPGSSVPAQVQKGKMAKELREKCEDLLDTTLAKIKGEDVPESTIFDAILEQIANLFLSRTLEGFKQSDYYKKYVQAEHYSVGPFNLAHFRTYRVLGRGAFGAVSAVQKKDTGTLFAMKEMDKKKIKFERCEKMVLREQQTLAKMRSPFVLRLRFSFQEGLNLYLVFDLCTGGDLKFHMRAQPNKRFPNDRARFYAAETLLGLEHIHSLGIVYRDLKPQNLLLTKAGHVVISDLGLTIELAHYEGRPIRWLAGTPGYWAPEVVSLTDTFFSSDYWSYGCLLYEMLWGRLPNPQRDRNKGEWTPFGGDDTEEVLAEKEPLKCVIKVNVDKETFSEEAKDLLLKIFVFDARERLGARGADEVKRHPYFANIDWNRLAAMQVAPPFVPNENEVNAKDLDELDEWRRTKFTRLKVEENDQHHYESFTYHNKYSLHEELVDALKRQQEMGDAPRKKKKNDDCCCVVS